MCKQRERRNGAVCIFTAHQNIRQCLCPQQVCSSLAILLLFLIQLNSTTSFSQIFQIKKSVSAWAILKTLTSAGFSGCRRGRRGGNGALAGSSLVPHLPCVFNLENCSSLRDSSVAPNGSIRNGFSPKKTSCLNGKIKDCILNSTISHLNDVILKYEISKKIKILH